MIKLRQLLHNRVIWQHLISRPNYHDFDAAIINSVWTRYIRQCSQLPSSTINQRNTEKDLQYFRNLSLELHPECNKSPAEVQSKSSKHQRTDERFATTCESDETDNSLKEESDFMTHQNKLSDLSNEISDVNEMMTNIDDYPAPSTFDILNPLAKRDVKLTDVPTNLQPSFNLAAYANKSTTLQQLVKLGVNLSRWDSMPDVPDYILKLDFEKDMKAHIQFLYDHGVPANELGKILTKNPLIFKHEIDDLQVRINYLESKKFSSEAIARILTKAPYFIIFSARQIDHRLGYLQKEFSLTGDELRSIVTRFPKLALTSFVKIAEKQLAIKEEMGFNRNEIKCLLLNKPKLWLIERRSLLERFQYVHNVMGCSHAMITNFPGVLLSRRFIIKQRHLYLQALGRAQYDPTKEGYVSLHAFVSGNDSDFCANVAKTSTKKFNDFLKTL